MLMKIVQTICYDVRKSQKSGYSRLCGPRLCAKMKQHCTGSSLLLKVIRVVYYLGKDFELFGQNGGKLNHWWK